LFDDLSIARAVHIFGVVLWIGGVAFVTTVLLPAVQRMKQPQERVAFFEEVEDRFAWQARVTTVLVGASGFYLAHVLNAWPLFFELAYWWLPAMVFVWLVFTVMLFIAEPLFLHRWFIERATAKPVETFRLIQRLHWVLLTLSLVTLVGAMLGVH